MKHLPAAPDPHRASQGAESRPARSRLRRHWPLIVVVALVAVLLWWLFRNVDLAEVWGHIRAADAPLLLASAVIAMAGFAVRALRWKYFLAPVQRHSPFASRFAAVAVGFMANNLLPSGRAGEPGRAYAYSRMEPVGFTAALATLVVERLLDGAVIFTLLFVAILAPDFPAETLPETLAGAMRIAAAGLGAALAGAVLVVAFPSRCLAVGARLVALLPSGRLSTGLTRVMEGVVGGLSSMRGWRLMLPALAWTFGVWLLQSLSFWAGFLAFDIRVPFAAAMLTNGAVAMAAALPATPGYLGTLQGAVSLALVGVYDQAAEPVLACAVAWHAVNFPPITVLGLWHARRLGISLKDFRGRGSEPGNPATHPAGTAPENAAPPSRTTDPAPDASP